MKQTSTVSIRFTEAEHKAIAKAIAKYNLHSPTITFTGLTRWLIFRWLAEQKKPKEQQ